MRHHSPIVLPRSYGKEFYRLRRENGIEEIDPDIFHKRYHIDNAIRIINDEYQFIDTTLPFFTHFNMEFSGNPIGARMLLPRIVTQGYFRHNADEVLPILSLSHTLIGVVVSKREHVPYKSLYDEVFRYSMTHIKNVEQLQQAILKRYRVSMPDLSDEEILARGVGITRLRLEKIFIEE